MRSYACLPLLCLFVGCGSNRSAFDVEPTKSDGGDPADAAAPSRNGPSSPDAGPRESLDPFDIASCLGPPMTVAEAQTRFTPGLTTATLGTYTMAARFRHCEPLTGCGPWKEASTASVADGANDYPAVHCEPSPAGGGAPPPSTGLVMLMAASTTMKLRTTTAGNTFGVYWGFECTIPTAAPCPTFSEPRKDEPKYCYWLELVGARFDDAPMTVTNHCLRASFKSPPAPPDKPADEAEAVFFARY